MQAIILAAGMGRRLADLTKNNTKCMVEVNGVTLIDRVLTQLSSLSLKKVILVIGYRGQELKTYIGNNYQGLIIEYIENSIYDKTNNIYSLFLAKHELEQDDTLLIESDLIFDDSVFSMILDNPYPNIALVAKYQTWMDGTMVRIDEENNITDFISKKSFKYSDIEYYYKTVNIYKFSKEFSQNNYIPFLEAYIRALGNNEYYEQVLRVITLLEGINLKALPLNGQKWYEIDDVQDLDIAQAIFANADTKLSLYQKRYGGYWRFPNLLDFCYLVNPYFPSLRMREEMKANFDILLADYPSGLEINNLLIAKYFGIKKDYVCVGNGAAELIKSLVESLSGTIGVIYPTFEEYPNRCSQKVIAYLPENPNFSYTVADLKSYFGNKNINTLLLINPDNPSGNFISKEEILHLAAWTNEKRIVFIVDESFVDFSENGANNSLLINDILEQFNNLIVVKSISKSYGVPGLRLGVVASANHELLTCIRKKVAIWNINSFGEFYMQIFGKYEVDYRKGCKMFVAERKRFYQELQKITFLRIIPSQANYFLCEILEKYSSRELAVLLLEKYDILIKDCKFKKGFYLKNYIRIAIRDEQDNNKLLNALHECV